MALIKCSECGKEYSNLAQACPNCGCPTQNDTNNKTTAKSPLYHDSNVEIDETAYTITKKYKKLPLIPRRITALGLFVLALLIGVMIAANFIAFADANLKNLIGFYSIVIMLVGVFFSMIGIYRLKRWGLIAFCFFVAVCLITLILTGAFTKLYAIFAPFVIYAICLKFEEAGHNTFDIVWNNGVIEEEVIAPLE